MAKKKKDANKAEDEWDGLIVPNDAHLPERPANGTARPYSFADFIYELKDAESIHEIDIIGRIHLITGFNRYAIILLRDELFYLVGSKGWDAIKRYFELVKSGKPYTPDEEFKLHDQLPEWKYVFTWEILTSLIDGKDPIYEKWICEGQNFSGHQIALIVHYNGLSTSVDDKEEIARRYGLTSKAWWDDWSQDIRDYEGRKRWVTKPWRNFKNWSEFLAIEQELTKTGKAKWLDEKRTFEPEVTRKVLEK